MDKLFPFRGYRYDPARSGPLENVVTQPYDKISPDMLKRYLQRSPFNVARVIKNPDYAEAGQNFADWIASGVLKRDERPSFYPYQQEFEIADGRHSRLGFVALVPLERPDFAVKGHENIHQAPLEDRLRLIRETESNDGLIFSLFSDPALRVDRLLADFVESRRPVAETIDEYGATHRLWRLEDASLQKSIADCFEGLSVYIADGHHRFQTALRYAEECRAKGWKAVGAESFPNRMMALFNMDGPGLRILPTHRAIRDLPSLDPEDLISDLESFFEIVPMETIEALDASMSGGGHRIGIATGPPLKFHLLIARPNLAESFMAGVVGTARELDVNILHEGILHPFMGIGEAELAKESHVDYFRDRDDMIARLANGQYQAAFVLNPTRLDQVRSISEEGKKMPQKSTDFFPKLLTGLVFMKMEIEK